jgi:hypothetical protein
MRRRQSVSKMMQIPNDSFRRLKSARFLAVVLAFLAGAFAAGPVLAEACHDQAAMAGGARAGEMVRPGGKDAGWLARATAEYPLDTCVVSGKKLASGGMGMPEDFICRQTGKPDRLVRFCSKNCLKEFNKDPAKYLKKIEDAAAAKAMAAMPGMSGMAGMQDMPMK